MESTASAITVVPVAPLLWAAYTPHSHPGDGDAIGHIDSDGRRFRVGLDGEDLEPYTFTTLGEAGQWFAEYCFALHLGHPYFRVASS